MRALSRQSDELRLRWLRLADAGLTAEQIAAETGHHSGYVRRELNAIRMADRMAHGVAG